MKLSIVYFNDVHGYLLEHPELFYEDAKEVIKTAGGYSRIASFIQSVRKTNPNTLVFDGGDTFHGTLPVVESKGEIIVPILRQLGISAMVGHWDFAYGPSQLLHLAGQLNYPVLGINVYKDNGELFLPPYIIQEIGWLKVAVIGICCTIIDKTMPKHFSEGLALTSGEDELPQYIEEVKRKGARLIILLSHNGFAQDYAMLSKVEGVDICLSAHTHNRLYQPAKAGNSLVIQCGCHGSFVGHLELDIEQDKIQGWSYRLVSMNEDVLKDEALEKQIRDSLEPYQRNEQLIMGNTAQLLHRYNALYSSMDDLLLAAIARIADCGIAFSNGWRYGAPIAEGNISLTGLYNIIPMNPPVSTVDLSGKEILQMLEENLERTFSSNPLHQMGGYTKRCLGIQAYIKIENPKGYRIQQLFIEGKRMDENTVHKVAFVTTQGVPEHLGKNRKKLPVRAVEAMAQFLQQSSVHSLVSNHPFITV